jgi:hypothetical protein
MTEKAKKLGNEPAHPIYGTDETPIYACKCGLTKREFFAAKAMQGLLADPDLTKFKEITYWAVQCADDLLEELSKEGNKESEY